MYQYHIPQNAMVILYHCRLSRRNYQYTIYRSTVSTHLHFYRCCCWQFWWFLGLHPRGGCCLESETHGAICCWWLAASWVLPTRAACYHCSPRGDLHFLVEVLCRESCCSVWHGKVGVVVCLPCQWFLGNHEVPGWGTCQVVNGLGWGVAG